MFCSSLYWYHNILQVVGVDVGVGEDKAEEAGGVEIIPKWTVLMHQMYQMGQ